MTAQRCRLVRDLPCDELLSKVKASRCAPALVACREHKPSHELDVVVTVDTPQTGARILAIGEVKATRSPVGLTQLQRLEHIATLLPPAMAPSPPRLLLFARHGFTLDSPPRRPPATILT